MTAKRTNGAHAVPDTIFPLAMMPTANSFLMGQRVAFEAARFWARRMRAYADQMEALASCTTPQDIAGAQTRFFDQMRHDYASESEAMNALMTPERRAVRENGSEAEA